jgi:3-hydroxyisobutyrate dehydrogenase
MLKDMKIALGLMRDVGSASRLGTDATRWWTDAADALPETADHTEIVRWVLSLAEDE